MTDFFQFSFLNFCLNFFLVERERRRSPDNAGTRERREKSNSEERVVEEPDTLDASAGRGRGRRSDSEEKVAGKRETADNLEERGRGRRSDSEENVKKVPDGEFFHSSENS
jgi:hypothetical protein